MTFLHKLKLMLGVITMAVTVSACAGKQANISGPAEDVKAIQALLEEAYLKGFYHELDPAKVKQGFHQDMQLAAIYEGQAIYVPLAEWMQHESVGADKASLSQAAKDKQAAKLSVDAIDIVGNTASVKARIHIKDKLIYTNFYGLYKVDGKWSVVTKLFEDHAH